MDLKRILIGSGGNSQLHIGWDLAEHIAQTVLSEMPAKCYCIISEASAAFSPLQREFEAILARESAAAVNGHARLLHYTVPAIHGIKTRTMKADIEDWLLHNMCKRDTVIISVGGEALGELVGFVASTYMRGLSYCAVPTTLLAMIDTSIGGKTGIDVGGARNAIGAFHQPTITFVDIARPGLLQGRTFLSGMAEVVKIAAVTSVALYEAVEAASATIVSVSRNTPTGQRSQDELRIISTIIEEAISQKAQIVAADPKEESGLRGLLNFGHTVGHVIEGLAQGSLLHGECVAIGMMLEAEISHTLGHLSQDSMKRLSQCLHRLDLPTSLQHDRATSCPGLQDIALERFLRLMKLDKKAARGQIDIVLLRDIGHTLHQRATTVNLDTLQQVLSKRLPRQDRIDKIAPGLPYARYPERATILITGMRGSGKTFLAKEASRVTGLQVLDADEEMERRLKQTVGQFVTANGWPAFRVEETALLKDLLQTHPTGLVISLGGGIVEIPESRQLMLSWMQQGGPVVHVIRDIEATFAYLTVDQDRPSLGESLHTIYARRKPFYEQCSSYQVMNEVGGPSARLDAGTSDNSAGSLLESHRFFRHITGSLPSTVPHATKRTSSLLLDTTDITKVLPHLAESSRSVNAIEVYVDSLGRTSSDQQYLPEANLVISQITQLRHNTQLPIIFTVRSPRSGKKLDVSSWDRVHNLYLLGIRLGCEMVTIDVEWEIEQLQDVISYRGYTKLLASYTGPLGSNIDEVVAIYQKAQKIGDVIRIYSTSGPDEDDTLIMQVKKTLPRHPPLIACNINAKVSKTSLVLNRHLTPVLHQDIPPMGDYAFMTSSDLQQARTLLAIPPEEYAGNGSVLA